MPPRNILLIGYRGTGKTTVARLVADPLGWNRVDSDVALAARHGRSIKDIFAHEGEAAFRDKEAQVLADLCKLDRQVIATGGGAILRPENRVLLRQAGLVVWLKADSQTIHARLQHDPTSAESRPALTCHDALEEIEQLLAARAPLYQSTAHLEIDTTGLDPEDVARAILKHMEAN